MTKFTNFWWIICLLSAIIIGLVSFIITQRSVDSAALIAYIGTCSTLLSIILSIIAIQYTYHSNIEVSRQFQNINTAADDIKSTATELTKLSGVLNDHITDMRNSITNIAFHQKQIIDEMAKTNNANNAPLANDIVNTVSPTQQAPVVQKIDTDTKQ